jgi:hypothetical protein
MFCPSRLFRCGYNRPIELPHLETFAGAACCRAFRSGRSPSAKFVAFETVRAKAAPLQAFGPLDTQRVCNPPVFLPHPSSALPFLGYSSSSSNTGKRSDGVLELRSY